jgi:signal transduction histidine kinase/DNA-binding response OmpR family regulator
MSTTAHLPSRRTLRAKLLRVMLSIFVPLVLATLACVAFVQYRVMTQSAHDNQRLIRDSVASKGRVLAVGHALALRGMVVDNGFSAVSELVQHAVKTDPDLVYGLFLSADDEAWVYVAPDRKGNPLVARDPQKWRELNLGPSELRAIRPSERATRLFDRDVLEFAAPVYDGDELLGTVRYGFSTARTHQELEAAQARAQQTLVTTLLILGLLAAVSLAVGVVLVGRASATISRPVGALAEAANTIAQGRRDVRVAVQSDDELELLAQAFNHMLEVNQRAFEQLEETTERALEASRVKSEFLANMSHEIRTPMNGVMGIATLMLQMQLDGKLRRYVETINASSTALLTIINDVLDFSKLESGKYTLQSVLFEPRVVIQEVAELLASQASEKGLEIVHRIDRSVPVQLRGDPDRFRQVLHNLVGNAVKFTERGEVFIELRTEPSDDGARRMLRVNVTDTGIGIAEKHCTTIFDAFAQVDGSMVRKHGGTGLGLAISKRLVEAMGGDIGVWSRPGMGSQFWFTFPGEAVATTPNAPVEILPPDKHALVIEQNHRWREVISDHMEVWGMNAESYPNIQTGIARVTDTLRTKHRFDVVVVGTPVGVMELRALLEAVEKAENRPRIPLIILNQPGTNLSLAELESRVVSQLAKPLRMSDLYNSLQDVFSGRRAKKQLANVSSRPRNKHGKKILVVDDNHVNQFVAVEQLQEAGYEADVAQNGLDAVEMTRDNDYLLVLMDCQMPVMDGYTATREIRRREQGTDQHALIIALTAHALTGERDRVLEAGMDDYLSKPLRANALEKMIGKHLAAASAAEHSDSGPVETTVHKPLSVAPPHNDTAEPAQPLHVLDPTVRRSRSFVEVCLREMPKQIDSIVAALEAGNFETLRQAAHKLKGGALAAAADQLASLAEKLQHAAEAKELEPCVDLTCAIQEHFVAVDGALQHELASLAS